MNIIEESKRAILLINHHKFKDAEKIYLNLLQTSPQNSTILNFLGLLYIKWEKYIKAQIIFEKAYNIEKSEISVYNLASLKERMLKYDEALNLYKDLINISPKPEYYVKITNLLINLIVFNDRNKYINELYYYTKTAIKIFPLDKNIILNFSIASIYSGHLEDGEKYCNLALKINPKFANAWSHLGLINEFIYSDEYKAQECYKKAILFNRYDKSDNKSNYYDIAISYTKTADYKKAANYFHKSLHLRPDNKTILLGLAQCYFQQRKFKLGYKYYIKYNQIKYKNILKTPWDGTIHKDKILFVYPDLGYGDQILFIRYLPYAAKKFKKVNVFAYPQLYNLFKEQYKNYSNIEFIKINNNKLPKHDYSVVLSNLPYYLKKDFKHIPGVGANYNKKINNIGICWEAGNNDIRTTFHRTIDIKEFESILNLTEYNFYSFQVGASNDDYKKYKNLKDLGKDFKDFKDTGNALKKMDLLISVDTSVANLAGSLGIKTFLLLPLYPDWRWFDNTDKTEWYDSVTIFKQTKQNSWDTEFEKLKQILK